MLRSYYLLLVLIVSISLPAAAQTKRIAQIRQQLYTAENDAQRLHHLLALCEEWESYSPDSFRVYITKADRLAKTQQAGEAQQQVAYYTGAWYFQLNKLDSAAQVATSQLRQMQTQKTYNNLYVKLVALSGNILFRTDKLDSALAIYYDLLKKAEPVADTFGIIKAQLGIGNVHLKLHKSEEALQWYFRCTGLMGSSPHAWLFPFLYNNMGLAFYNLDKEDSCYYYVRKGIEQAQEQENLTNLANAWWMYGGFSAGYGRLKQAEEAFTHGLAVRKQIGDIYYLIGDMATLAFFYASVPEPARGIALCKEGLELARQNGRALANIKDLYAALGKNYKAAGDYKQYGEVQEKLLQLQDSSYRQNTAEKLAEIQTLYEVQKKENTIMQQQLKLMSAGYQLTFRKYLLYGAGLLLLIAVAAGIVFFRNYRKKQQLRLALVQADEQHRSAQAVMKAEESERKRIAADLHDSLGAYAASISSNIDLVMAPENNGYAEKALHELRNNAQSMVAQLGDTIWVLQKESLSLTAISDRIKVFIQKISPSYPAITVDVVEDITHDHSLPPSQAFHLFQIMKEAVNNALRHGEGRQVTLLITGHEHWQVRISDNGKGMVQGAMAGSGNGIQNMKQRARQCGCTIEWQPASPGGTQVVIMPTAN